MIRTLPAGQESRISFTVLANLYFSSTENAFLWEIETPYCVCELRLQLGQMFCDLRVDGRL